MGNFLNGIGMGFALSILAGPLLFALVQTSLERGLRAGLAVGLGIWASDLLFIAASYLGLAWLQHVTEWPFFEKTLGSLGGLFLIGIGAAILVRSAPGPETRPLMGNRLGSLGSMWVKGFLINTINPFTVFFWTSTATGVLLEERRESWPFYLGIMLVLVLTDSLKVIAAKAVRPWLKPRNLLLARRLSGLAILGFGFALMARAWMDGA